MLFDKPAERWLDFRGDEYAIMTDVSAKYESRFTWLNRNDPTADLHEVAMRDFDRSLEVACSDDRDFVVRQLEELARRFADRAGMAELPT